MDIPIGGLLLVQLCLIVLRALLAAAEAALLSLNETKLRHQAEEGDKKAAKLLATATEPAGFLATVQWVITLAAILAGALSAIDMAEPLVKRLVDVHGFSLLSRGTTQALCVVLVALALSFLTLVLGELVPRRIALKHAERTAKALHGLVRGFSVLFHPLIWLLTKAQNAVLRLLRIDPAADEEDVTEDEIRMMVDIGEEKGAIETNERDMIENIFEFNNMAAVDCMTHRTDMVALHVDDSTQEVLSVITESGKSRFPVYDEDLDDILGTVTTRDFLLALATGEVKSLRDILRPAYFVPESVRTDVLFREMQGKKTHLAIVVDEYGGTSGLITMEDLLEEIVGNIDDEYDPTAPQDIQRLSEDSFRIAGGTDLETMAEALDMDLPLSEEFETLGGLIFSCLAAIPKDGTHPEVTCHGLRIRVEEIVDRRVEWATVTILPRESTASEDE